MEPHSLNPRREHKDDDGGDDVTNKGANGERITKNLQLLEELRIDRIGNVLLCVNH